LKQQSGFSTHKLKGGVFPPRYELECYRALAAALPGDSLRFDPNGVWSTEQAVWFGRKIEDLNNAIISRIRCTGCTACGASAAHPHALGHEYRRRRVRAVGGNVLQPAVDVILLDTTFWGGIGSA
jgi:glucarate dehydratase